MFKCNISISVYDEVMKKVSFGRSTILISILAASSLILGVATAYYHEECVKLRQTYSSLHAEHGLLEETYYSLVWEYEKLKLPNASLLLFDYSGPKPEPNMLSYGTPQIMITYPYGLQEYADAILKICDTALSKYLAIFGISCPNIHVFIYIESERPVEYPLGTTPENYRIYSYLASTYDLRPSARAWVYGYTHEIGHIIFRTDNWTFNEGWADYAAGFRIVSEVYRELGDDAWPKPYNYSEREGRERFLRLINDPAFCQPNTMYAAGKILYTIDQKYGPSIFKSAIVKMQPTRVGMYRYPIYKLEEFKSVLVELTNDTSIPELFSQNGF